MPTSSEFEGGPPDPFDDHAPPAANPLQAQTQWERRVWREDMTAHMIAILMVIGFFGLAFTALLGFVDLSLPAVATFLGTVLGYAVGKLDPILVRYYRRGADISTTTTVRGAGGAPEGAAPAATVASRPTGPDKA